MQRSLQQSKRIQTLIEFDTHLLCHYMGMDKLEFQKLYEWLKDYTDTPSRRSSKMILSLIRSWQLQLCCINVFSYLLSVLHTYSKLFAVAHFFHIFPNKLNWCLICTNNFITALITFLCVQKVSVFFKLHQSQNHKNNLSFAVMFLECPTQILTKGQKYCP